MNNPIRIVIVDDHPVYRDGLKAGLAELPGITIVGEAADGAGAVDSVQQHKPDIVLMDLRMPGVSGLAATARITTSFPGTEVIVLTMSEDDDSIFAALRAGASGYLLKEADASDVHRTVQAIARGESVWGPRIAARVKTYFKNTDLRADIAAFPQLTPREREVLTLTARGLDNAAIAAQLFLSKSRVRNLVHDINRKLQARSRAEAISMARDAGL